MVTRGRKRKFSEYAVNKLLNANERLTNLENEGTKLAEENLPAFIAKFGIGVTPPEDIAIAKALKKEAEKHIATEACEPWKLRSSSLGFGGLVETHDREAYKAFIKSELEGNPACKGSEILKKLQERGMAPEKTLFYELLRKVKAET